MYLRTESVFVFLITMMFTFLAVHGYSRWHVLGNFALCNDLGRRCDIYL